MIKAVTFDFWETLVRDSPENLREQRALRIQALHRVLAGAGSGIGEVEVAEAYDRSERVLVERFWGRDRDPSIRPAALVSICLTSYDRYSLKGFWTYTATSRPAGRGTAGSVAGTTPKDT